MKAIVYERYGPPDVLELKEVAKPTPGDSEILIKVRATTVTSADWRARSLIVPPGYGVIARLAFGLLRPRKKILGTELAGTVKAVGSNVTRFRKGDDVIAYTGLDFGCYADYKVMADMDKVVRKPPNLSFAEAASLFFGGATALVFLRTKGNVQSGEKVLIIGASGAVGSAAVQLAKHFGADVTGVCSTANLDLVRSIGADRVIDYTKQDFTQSGETYDIVFDTVGAKRISESIGSLKPGGRLLLAAEGLADLVRIPWINLRSDRKVTAGTAMEQPEDLRLLVDLAEAGKFRPVIDRTYPFKDIRQAHAYVGTGRKKGNVVVTLDDPNDD